MRDLPDGTFDEKRRQQKRVCLRTFEAPTVVYGHGAYKEQRFVLEGRKIAHSVGGCQQPARPRAILCGPTATTVSLDQHLYEYAAAVWANATHPPPTYMQSITSDEGDPTENPCTDQGVARGCSVERAAVRRCCRV